MNKVDMYKADAEWRKKLSAEQYHALREKGTEPAFTGKYVHNKKNGTYYCAACGAELFSSKTKFDSGSGWPSFWDAIDKNKIGLREDDSFWMHRVEAVCAVCKSHLGHLFDDGPKPTGKRYCINSISLDFKEQTQK